MVLDLRVFEKTGVRRHSAAFSWVHPDAEETHAGDDSELHRGAFQDPSVAVYELSSTVFWLVFGEE